MILQGSTAAHHCFGYSGLLVRDAWHYNAEMLEYFLGFGTSVIQCSCGCDVSELLRM